MKKLLFLLALLTPSLARAQTSCTVPAFYAADTGKTLAVSSSGVCSWQALGSNAVDLCALGIDTTGTNDVAATVNAAFAAAGPTGTSVGNVFTFCPGKFRLSSPLRINRQVILEGAGGWGAATPSTWLFPDKNVSGIVVDSPATSTDGGNGEWSTIRNLAVIYASQTTTTWLANHAYAAGTAVRAPTGSPNHMFVFITASGGTSGGSVPASFATATTAGSTITDNTVTWTVTRLGGIVMFERAFLQNFAVGNSPGNGVHVEGFTPSTNANGWSMLNGAVSYAALNGYFVRGSDANAGAGRNLDCFGPGYWCFYDLSGGSNKYDTCQAAGATLGGYTNTNGSINVQNLYSNCYSESGDPASLINAPSIIENGTLAASNTGSASWWNGGFHFGQLYFDGTGTNVPYTVFGTYAGAAFTLGSNTHYYSFFPDTDSGGIDDCWKFNNADAQQPVCYTNGSHIRGGGYEFLPNGTLFQNGRDFNRSMLNYGNAAPVSGGYFQGDTFINATPTNDTDPIGWRQIAFGGLGTPGTWVPVFSGAGSTLPTTIAPTGTAATINWRNGPTQKLDVTSATGTVTVTLQNPGGGGRYWIEVIEGGTARQLTFSPAVKYSGGAPTFALNTTNTIECLYDGSNYLCVPHLAYQ